MRIKQDFFGVYWIAKKMAEEGNLAQEIKDY